METPVHEIDSDKCTIRSLKSGDEISWECSLLRACQGDPSAAYVFLQSCRLRFFLNATYGMLDSHFTLIICMSDRILPVSTLIAEQTKHTYA